MDGGQRQDRLRGEPARWMREDQVLRQYARDPEALSARIEEGTTDHIESSAESLLPYAVGHERGTHCGARPEIVGPEPTE